MCALAVLLHTTRKDMLEVLKTMPESDYRSSVEKRTNFKLKVRYFRNFSYIGLKPVSGVAIWSLGGGDD